VPDVGAELVYLGVSQNFQPVHPDRTIVPRPERNGFDFNILTAFIRLGRAGPAGAGCPPYYYFYYLTSSQYFKIKVKVKVKVKIKIKVKVKFFKHIPNFYIIFIM